MMGLLSKIKEFFKRSNGVENDSETLVVLVRILCVLLTPYFLIVGIFLVSQLKEGIGALFIAGAAVLMFLLFRSFSVEIQKCFWPLILILFLTTLFSCSYIGWGLGFQNHLYCIVLLLLFNPKLSLRLKRSFCFVGLALLILLAVMQNYQELLPFTKAEPAQWNSLILVVNEITFFICVCAIGLTFAGISQEAEHKLFLYNEKLKQAASTDPLTGLMNRRSMENSLQQVANQYKNGTAIVTVAMADIDFFKKVNDTYGHDAGDYILKNIGEELLQFMSGKGDAARWGGEEFLLVFYSMNGDEVFTLLDHFRLRLGNRKFVYREQEIHIHMTFGIAEYDASPSFVDTIKDADQRLYLGKSNGRNQVVF